MELIIHSHLYIKNKIIEASRLRGKITLQTDKLLTSRVLGNMVINALKAKPTGGMVRIMTKVDGGNVIWEVWNNGFIVEKVKKRIFQRHFSTKSNVGRGLGASSMKPFGEEYLNGEVSFKSTQSKGTTFVFRLPGK